MEGAPSDAAARGEPRKAPADGSASKGSAEEENSFDRLPDELVQRIFSELEATEAYERIRLWAVDRRFGRLVRGVHWKELRIGFEQLARRAIARLKHGAFLGAARVVVGSLCHRRWARELQGHEVHEPAVDEIGAIQKAAYATTTLLGALATSPVPPREVQFDSFGAGRGLLSVGEEERQLQDLLSMERLALSLLLALCPADSLHSLVVSGSDWLGQSVAEVARPGAVPPAVHRLELEGDSLSGENMECFALTALRRAWPGLQSLRCSGISREALVELAAFHNLSEITAEMSASDEDNHNMGLDPFSWDMDAELAIIASSPCAPRLRVFDLFPCVGPAGLRSLLGFCALERLTVEVDHRSTGVLHGLAELSMLRSIFLLINVRDATDEGAGLLRAAGAAIEACKRLERTEISVFVEAPVGNRSVVIDQAAAAALFRAARPSLAVWRGYFEPGCPSVDLLGGCPRRPQARARGSRVPPAAGGRPRRPLPSAPPARRPPRGAPRSQGQRQRLPTRVIVEFGEQHCGWLVPHSEPCMRTFQH